MESQLKRPATGLNSPPQCNVHKAVDVGNKLLTQLHGSNPMTVVIKKVDLCIQMPATANLAGTAHDTKKVHNPNLLFQRAIPSVSALGFSSTMADVFSHELHPYPLSIFEESEMMRSTKKSEMVDVVIGSLSTKTDRFSSNFMKL